MTDYQRIILVHYHEIGLKGHNRASFETRLQKNLEALLAGYPVVTIHRISGRICVFLREGTGWDTAVEASELARGVPGVARVSSGFKCERDLDVMADAAERAMREAGEFASFKVAARRNHTDFAVGSMDMNRIIGAKLCAAFPEAEVRMKGPDLMVGVEVVQNASYVYARSRPGIGGLPVGSSGTVMCLLSSGIDSPVALWRLARRGAVCVGVHFSGRPQTSGRRHSARAGKDGVRRARLRRPVWRRPARDIAARTAVPARDPLPPPHVQGDRAAGCIRACRSPRDG